VRFEVLIVVKVMFFYWVVSLAEDGDSILRNVGICLRVHTASQPKRTT
jgi:hypothetical protein